MNRNMSYYLSTSSEPPAVVHVPAAGQRLPPTLIPMHPLMLLSAGIVWATIEHTWNQQKQKLDEKAACRAWREMLMFEFGLQPPLPPPMPPLSTA